MQVESVKMNKDKARELYLIYKAHKVYEKPEDYEIMRTYQLIALGRVIIQAMASIKEAGLDSDGLPKLAIARADAKECVLEINRWGGGFFGTHNYYRKNTTTKIEFVNGFFPASEGNKRETWDTKAMVPFIPPMHRPKRALANYYILWEAEWEKKPPAYPYLLRRIGNSDMWIVCAAWDLTPVEQAAMRTKMLIY